MWNYEVFGGCLRSGIEFPELHRLSGATVAPDWTLRSVQQFSAPAGELLGEVEIGPTSVRLQRGGSAYRLEFDDTGTFEVGFEVGAGGSDITHAPTPDAEPELIRMDVLNRVLPLALHARGALCLHGSAVQVGDTAIGFLAPKRHGKSTLALALTARGARLASDDTLAIEVAGHPLLRPGVHSVRLWGDSADRLTSSGVVRAAGKEGKRVVVPGTRDELMRSAAPLGALYVLNPLAPDAPRAAERVRMPPLAGAMSLIAHTRLAGLLGGREAAVVLDRAGELAGAVPVYRLDLVRDFTRLDAVVEQILEWHASASVFAPVAASSS